MLGDGSYLQHTAWLVTVWVQYPCICNYCYAVIFLFIYLFIFQCSTHHPFCYFLCTLSPIEGDQPVDFKDSREGWREVGERGEREQERLKLGHSHCN